MAHYKDNLNMANLNDRIPTVANILDFQTKCKDIERKKQ
jgi:hypothetical protein